MSSNESGVVLRHVPECRFGRCRAVPSWLFAFEGVLGGAYRGIRVVVVRWPLKRPV